MTKPLYCAYVRRADGVSILCDVIRDFIPSRDSIFPQAHVKARKGSFGGIREIIVTMDRIERIFYEKEKQS